MPFYGQYTGFGAGGVLAPATVSLTHNSFVSIEPGVPGGDTAADPVHTYTSKSLGAAAANRKIILVIFAAGNSASTTILSVTVAGSSASKLVGISQGETLSEIWVLDLASGTTGTVIVTFSTIKEHSGLGIFRLLTSATAAHATGSDNLQGGVAPSTTLNVPANGIAVLGAGSDSGGDAVVLTGVTEVYDVLISGAIAHAGGLVVLPGGETGRTMATDQAEPNSGCLVCVSYGP